MSSSAGFTEDDQARIAEEVLNRVAPKRTGLGFNGGQAGNAVPSSGHAASSSSSALFTESSARQEYAGNDILDRTQGPFAWDGGQRGTSTKGESRSRRDRGGIKKDSARDPETDCPTEREFPMVRERDIARMKAGTQENVRKRSRSRSRSRSRERRRRERHREWQRERQRDREHERDRDRDRDRKRKRDRERDRERDKRGERDRDRERYRTNGRSLSPNTSRSRDEDKTQRRDEEVDKAIGPPLTVEQAKAAINRRLQHVVKADTTLKTGAKATVDGGMGWERPEMAGVSDYFQNDEIALKGGVASVAPEYEARLAEILAVNDEDVVTLGDQKPQPTGTAGGIASSTLEQKHHDAIFAPTGSVPELPPSAPVPATRYTGGIAAAARARLKLMGGKAGEESLAKSVRAPTSANKKDKKSSQPRQDDLDDQPLFKTLRTGETVEAEFTEDDKWYKAVIIQVIHGGYENAKYKVRYTDYGNEETVPWGRIRRLKPAESPAPVNQAAGSQALPQQEDGLPADEAASLLTRMHPRALYVEKNDSPKAQSSEGAEVAPPADEAAQCTDVVNPVLLSATIGRKLSWKEKLLARKKRVKPGGIDDPNPKKISLVSDFAAHRRENEVIGEMDKSEWRKRVVFGIGNSKR